jgi:hypothetical protein
MDDTGLRWSGQNESVSSDAGFPKMLEPDVLLPCQMYDRPRGHAGLEAERRLMLAILEDAVSCYQKYAGATGVRARRLFREADEWFQEEDVNWVFSFESICAVLDFEPTYFREHLARWKDDMLAQPADVRARIGRVRLRAARRHKILPFVPRRRNRKAAVAVAKAGGTRAARR